MDSLVRTHSVTDFEIRPKIVCVAVNNTHGTVFMERRDGRNVPVKIGLGERLKIANRTRDWYLTAPGNWHYFF